MAEELSYDQLRTLYAWIDAIPLSRPKKNICRDFSDGVLLAEVVAAYFPSLVELHNYPPANSTKQKVYNFETLNQRVLKKFMYQIPHQTIEDIVNCKQGAIENVLNTLQFKMAKYREKIESKKDISSPKSARGPAPSSNYGQQQTPRDYQNEQLNNHNHMNRQQGNQQHKPQQQQQNQQPNSPSNSVDAAILLEKEQIIRELTGTVEVLELKVAKLEQLLRLKDNKIQKLSAGAR